jgi:hypothetical protein
MTMDALEGGQWRSAAQIAEKVAPYFHAKGTRLRDY